MKKKTTKTQSNIIKKILLLLCFIAGCLLCFDAVVLLTFTQSFGNFLVLFLGITFILIAVYYNKLNCWLKKTVKIAMAIGIPMCIFMVGLIATGGKVNTTTFTEDYIIVLGAGIKGETVLLPLQKRLDKCIEYISVNPNATIIVSGGQGIGESISEALAMERYLIARGVDKSKIIKEEQATDTYENFIYSRAIIDSLSKNTLPNIVFITNDFHVYRSARIAKRIGLDVNSYSAKLPLYLLPPTYLREILSIFKFWVYR